MALSSRALARDSDRNDARSGTRILASAGWELTLTAIAVLFQLVLVWGFEFFPSVDGPAHLHLAYGLREAMSGDAFYSQFIELNEAFNPNLLTQGILFSLVALVSPFIAEKLFLTLYFVSFAAASVYALSRINRNALCFAPFLVFCSISFPVAFGFYNFSFSAAVFLCWYGFWWHHRGSISKWVILGHALFAGFAYLTHIFAFVVTWFAISATVFGLALQQIHENRRSGNGVIDWQKLRTLVLPPLLASVPEIVSAAIFLFLRFGEHTASAASQLWTPKLSHLFSFITATSLAPYDTAEYAPALAFVLLSASVVYLLFRSNGNVRSSIPFAVCFLAFLVLYLVMPFQWIVRWMPARFQSFVFIVMVLWMAALLPPIWQQSRRRVIALAGTAILATSFMARANTFSQIDSYYREYASIAPYIASDSTLIGLRLHKYLNGKQIPAKMDVLFQAGSRIATMRHAVDLKNFQGQSPDHPIQFRPGTNATAALGGNSAITDVPPRVDLLTYERQTGRAIDYVILWGFREEISHHPSTAALYEQLDRHYRLIFTSKPRGLANLYARDDAIPLPPEPESR